MGYSQKCPHAPFCTTISIFHNSFHIFPNRKRLSDFSESPIKSNFSRSIKDYSMIVATRPDPTVRPPSRYLNTVFLHIFYAFRWQNLQKTAVFAYCIFICLSSWHRFGTVGTSSSFTNTNLNYRSASPNFHRPLWIFAPAPSIAPAIMIAATIIAIAIIILPIRCWYSFIVMSPFKF